MSKITLEYVDTTHPVLADVSIWSFAGLLRREFLKLTAWVWPALTFCVKCLGILAAVCAGIVLVMGVIRVGMWAWPEAEEQPEDITAVCDQA